MSRRELWWTYGETGGTAHLFDRKEPDGLRLVPRARCGFWMDYGMRGYQHVGRPKGSELCARCLDTLR